VSISSVLSLIQPLFNMGYCLTTDNFYSSPELFRILLNNGIDAYGTVRVTRTGLPDEIKRIKLTNGENIVWIKGKLMALKWKDKRDLCMLSTIHNGHMVNVKTRGNKELLKPDVVVFYNKTMGGEVDKSDQGMTFYPIMRNQQKKVL
jgi:Transposase IS4